MDATPRVLEGATVRLEPMSPAHLPGLCAAGLDPELWRWIPRAVRDESGMRAYVEEALAWQKAGTALPFVTVERHSDRIVGSTRFANMDAGNRRLEIGWTWVARAWQRTAVNTEAKLLMLGHAFGALGCRRVEFKTDALNARSRAALLRLGAKEEGVFRRHMATESGRVRDTVYFSIIDEEWPAVRERLSRRP